MLALIKNIKYERMKDMSTTKFDLLRDVVTDALLDFDLVIDNTDDGEGATPISDSMELQDIVSEFLETLDNYGVIDEAAQKQDFTIKVVMDKKFDTHTEFGEITPSEEKGETVL